MKTTDLVKPITAVPGFPGYYVKTNTQNVLMGLAAEGKKAADKFSEIEEIDEESALQLEQPMLRYLYQNYIVDKDGNLFEDMASEDADMGESLGGIRDAVMDIISPKRESKNVGTGGQN